MAEKTIKALCCIQCGQQLADGATVCGRCPNPTAAPNAKILSVEVKAPKSFLPKLTSKELRSLIIVVVGIVVMGLLAAYLVPKGAGISLGNGKYKGEIIPPSGVSQPTTPSTEPFSATSTEQETTVPETTTELVILTEKPAMAIPRINPDDIELWYYHADIDNYRAVLIDNQYKQRLTLSKSNFYTHEASGNEVKKAVNNSYVLLIKGVAKEYIDLEYLADYTTGTYKAGEDGPTKMFFFDPYKDLRNQEGKNPWDMITGFDRDPPGSRNYVPAVYKLTIPQGDGNPPEIRYVKLNPY